MNLKEFSAAIGYSQTTVSRALNGYPEVNEKTRQAIISAAERLNYRPNARARSLASGRSWTIGHVLPISSQHELINPVFSEFIAGSSEVYAARGYELLLKMTPKEKETEVYNTLWANGRVDGVILHGPTVNDERIPLLNGIGIPYVVHGRSSSIDAPYAWVDMDNLRAIRHATSFLIDLGHRRIGLINGLAEMDFAHRRRIGYGQALAKAGIGIDETIITHAELTEQNGYKAADRMLSSDNPPTAFLAASYVVAIGVRRAIRERDLKIGRDVSVLIHDDGLSYFNNNEDIPLFTATRSSVRDAGIACAQALINVIENPDTPPINELIRAHLTVGKSTAPALRPG